MEQQNKPAFGTSDFAVSAVEASDYIDVKAEESCPAESAPVNVRAFAETPSAATLEVMDQLKALAQNVTQGGRDSLDESKAASVQSGKSEDLRTGDPGGSHAPEPSLSVFPRPSGFENGQVLNGRSRSGKVLAVAGFVMAAVTGAGATFAWQAHNKPAEAARAAAPAPVSAAPVIAPYLGRQLEDLAQDISSVRARMEELAAKQQQLATAQQQLVAVQQQLDQLAAKQQQLAAKQEQAGQGIAKLHALEQARQRTPAPMQTRAAPAPPPQPYVPSPPIEPAMQPPPPPPRTASHPVPPMPIPR